MFFLSDEMPFSFDELLLFGAASGGKAIEDTATGNPLVFLTNLARPLKSLLIPFTPQQEGTGDPSPQNIRSILPWNGLKVWNGGKNLFNKNDPDIQLDKRIATGGTIINSQYSQAVTGFIPVKEGTRYSINNYSNPNYFSCFYSEKDISKPVGAIFGNNEFPKIAPSGAKYLIVTIGNTGIDTFQLEVGSSATAYEPYQPITDTDIVFTSSVYGGTLDVVSGVLTVEWASLVFDGSSDETWYFVRVDTTDYYRAYINMPDAKQPNNVAVFADSYKAVSFDNRSFSSKVCFMGNENETPVIFALITDLTTLESFKAYLTENPLTIVYQLATPQEITLTPQQITALKGENTIWSDADGSMTAVYFKKA